MERLGETVYNGKEIELTTDNTALYRFVGKCALYNHLWLSIPKEISPSGRAGNSHVWQNIDAHSALYTHVSNRMVKLILSVSLDPEVHLNQRATSAQDIKYFDRVSAEQFKYENEVPAAWLDK